MRMAWNWSPWRPRKRAFERTGFVFGANLIAAATENASMLAQDKRRGVVLGFVLIAMATKSRGCELKTSLRGVP